MKAAQYFRHTELLSNFLFRILTRDIIYAALYYSAISLSLVTILEFFFLLVFVVVVFFDEFSNNL